MRCPVGSCRLERRWYSRRCGADACDTGESGDAATLDFRPDGNLSRRSQHNPDGSEWTSLYEYDDTGRLTQIRTETPGGAAKLSFYEYDDAARLLRVFARNEDGEHTVETYEYDSSGGKSKTLHVDLAAHRSDTHYAYGIEGTDSAYSAPGAAGVTTFYNHRDQPAQLLFRDRAGRELSRVEFRYDDAGHLTEEAQSTSEEILPPEVRASLNPAQMQTVRGFLGAGGDSIRRTHAYDEQGRRTETCSNIEPLGFDRKTSTYNEHGDLFGEVYEHEEREYAIDEQGRIANAPARTNASRSEIRFRYDYDSQGNWVAKTVEGRSGSEGEFSVSSVERRILTYFA